MSDRIRSTLEVTPLPPSRPMWSGEEHLLCCLGIFAGFLIVVALNRFGGTLRM